jgi:hypothetical protein
MFHKLKRPKMCYDKQKLVCGFVWNRPLVLHISYRDQGADASRARRAHSRIYARFLKHCRRTAAAAHALH